MELLIAALVPFIVLAPVLYLQFKKSQELTEKLKKLSVNTPVGPVVVPASVVAAPRTNPSPQGVRVVDESQLVDARNRAREVVFEAKDEALKIRKEAEDYVHRVKLELSDQEKKLKADQITVSQKTQELTVLERNLSVSRDRIKGLETETERVRNEQTEALSKIASLTREEAKRQILENVEKDLSEEIAKRIRAAEEKIKEDSGKRAKEILVEAMRLGATDYVAEYTVSVVKLTDEEMKGRIIGKEGRNIRSFELATQVDVDLDEPKEIRLSCFDPIRREVAKVSLEKLIADGRIQPAKIEEIVAKTRKEIEGIIHEEGEKLAHAVEAYNLPLEIIDILGRFKYRFSYGQNMIAHTLEETRIGIKLAYEVGADVEVVRLGCLLHDIGKVITDDEGTHIQLGADLLRRFKLPEKVINAVAEHHEDKPFSSIESVLVYISDAISGARPGARVEDIEAYVKRMKTLEEAALSFKGVKSSFAISAGREVRVVVEPLEVDDATAVILAHDIAAKIEKEQTYPGQVKVTVIRETRATGVAK